MFNDDRSMSQARCRGCCRKYSRRGPGAAMPNTAKTVVACGEVSFHDSRGAVSQPHVYGADDSCCGTQVAVTPACAFGSNPLNEFGLTDNTEFFRAIRAIHGSAFDEYRLPHVMALHVCCEIVEKVDLRISLRCIPEVVMRIDDRQLWFECF